MAFTNIQRDLKPEPKPRKRHIEPDVLCCGCNRAEWVTILITEGVAYRLCKACRRMIMWVAAGTPIGTLREKP